MLQEIPEELLQSAGAEEIFYKIQLTSLALQNKTKLRSQTPTISFSQCCFSKSTF